MEEYYVKETKILEKSKEEQKEYLIKSIIETRKNLDIAHKNFEFADSDLIDFYTYQIKANQAKLDYLTKLAKKLDLKKNRP